MHPLAAGNISPRAGAQDRSLLLAGARDLLLAGYLLITFVGTRPLAVVSAAERAAGNPLDRIVLLALVGLSATIIIGNREAALRRIQSNLLLYAIVVFCQISVLWSDYPELSLRRAVLLGFLTVITTGLAATVDDLRRFHSFLFFGLGAVMLANLAATALWPEQAISEVGVQGLYSQKNVAGSVAMITVIVGVSWMAGTRSALAVVFGLIALLPAGLFLILSLSKTSMALTVLTLALGGLCVIAQHAGPRFAILVTSMFFLFATILLGFLIYYDFDAGKLFGFVLTDTSFSGRDELWSYAWKSAMEREWLGHGYGAFWDVGEVNDPLTKLEPGTWLGDVEKGIINQAHNGYLELWLHIGLPATAAAVAYVIFALGRSIAAAISPATTPSDRPLNACIAMLLFTYLLHNMTEASLFMRGIPYFNLVLLLALLPTESGPARPQASRIVFEHSSA